MKPAAVVAPEITEAEIVNRWDLATGREERAEKTLAETRLEKGRILVEARKMYPATGRSAGGWGRLLEKLRVDGETARRYMLLAGHVEKAPQSEEVPTYAEAGIVKPPPEMQLVARGESEILERAREIRAAQQEERRAERIETIRQASTGAAPLDIGRRFPIIYADPPWSYDDSNSRGAAEDHYPTMPLADICALPVGEHATDDAVLLLWATSALLPDAFEVMRAWGFEYRSSSVWVKSRQGLGHWFRVRHEFLLVGVRGKFPPPSPSARPDSVVSADLAEHSAKPERFYELIESMWPDLPRLELFARSSRLGWDRWGNQANQGEAA